jgi:ribonuclease-3
MLELIAQLKANYGLEIHNLQLLQTAFTHPSYAFENGLSKSENNERLEFLGDATLSLIIAEYLFEKYPEKQEGELSKIRSSIVRSESLAGFAKKLNLGDYLLLGKGEEQNGGRDRNKNLEDLYEAFLGAVFLDQGFEETKRFVSEAMLQDVAHGNFEKVTDYKTSLQEILQVNGPVSIEYVVEDESGPAHMKNFVVAVFFEGKEIGRGSGKSKKVAAQAAAKNAIESQQVN